MRQLKRRGCWGLQGLLDPVLLVPVPPVSPQAGTAQQVPPAAYMQCHPGVAELHAAISIPDAGRAFRGMHLWQ